MIICNWSLTRPQLKSIDRVRDKLGQNMTAGRERATQYFKFSRKGRKTSVRS